MLHVLIAGAVNMCVLRGLRLDLVVTIVACGNLFRLLHLHNMVKLFQIRSQDSLKKQEKNHLFHVAQAW